MSKCKWDGGVSKKLSEENEHLKEMQQELHERISLPFKERAEVRPSLAVNIDIGYVHRIYLSEGPLRHNFI